MRRISSELSPCRRVEMSRVSLRDLQRYQGCWRLCQEGIWKGLLPGCQVWLHPLLPTNLGTGMRASVHVDLPGWTNFSVDALKARCEELQLQPRGTRGESGGQTGHTYDISNKHRLGYSEVELVQTMIDGVNTLYAEDLELQKKHGL